MKFTGWLSYHLIQGCLTRHDYRRPIMAREDRIVALREWIETSQAITKLVSAHGDDSGPPCPGDLQPFRKLQQQKPLMITQANMESQIVNI